MDFDKEEATLLMAAITKRMNELKLKADGAEKTNLKDFRIGTQSDALAERYEAIGERHELGIAGGLMAGALFRAEFGVADGDDAERSASGHWFDRLWAAESSLQKIDPYGRLGAGEEITKGNRESMAWAAYTRGGEKADRLLADTASAYEKNKKEIEANQEKKAKPDEKENDGFDADSDKLGD
jgi:hypothetical protein